MSDEPQTIENALDIMHSWDWLIDGIARPDKLEGESDDELTNRMIREGVAAGKNRQCSIGWHEECSDRSGINHEGDCQCACHQAEWRKIGDLLEWLRGCLEEVAS